MADEKPKEPQSFRIVTTCQVERTYTVTAGDEEQAKKRLRSFLQDADMVAPGLVTEHEDGQRNTTTEQMKVVEKDVAAGPRAVESAAG